MKAIPVLAAMLLLLTAFAATAAAQPQSWRFDFENGLPDDLIIKDAQLATNPALVIGGTKSLCASTLDSDGDWHEFLHTGPAVKLKPSTNVLRTAPPTSGSTSASCSRNQQGRGTSARMSAPTPEAE